MSLLLDALKNAENAKNKSEETGEESFTLQIDESKESCKGNLEKSIDIEEPILKTKTFEAHVDKPMLRRNRNISPEEEKEIPLDWELPPVNQSSIEKPDVTPIKATVTEKNKLSTNASDFVLLDKEKQALPEHTEYAPVQPESNRTKILLFIFLLIGTTVGTVLIYIIGQTDHQNPAIYQTSSSQNQYKHKQQAAPVAINKFSPKKSIPGKALLTNAQVFDAPGIEKKGTVKEITAVNPITTIGKESPLLSSLDSPTVKNTTVTLKEKKLPEKKIHSNIKIVKHNKAAATDSIIVQAYQAYQQGQFKKAHRYYAQALRIDDRNRDALLGLAALAVHSQHTRLAIRYYKAALILNPNDSAALSGLISLSHGKSTIQSISTIKQLIKQRPETAALYFVLGNLYASSKNWPEAQSAYFSSWRLDNSNPDYAYNLAISLDSLGQASSAISYYKIALKVARHRAARFNKSSIRRRIQTLSASLRGAK